MDRNFQFHFKLESDKIHLRDHTEIQNESNASQIRNLCVLRVKMYKL